MNELIEIVNKDILECEKILKVGSAETIYVFQGKIEGKYYGIIDKFSAGLQGVYDEYDDISYFTVKSNVELLKEKLEMFKAMGCKTLKTANDVPSVQITNSNTNYNKIEINISFEQARHQVEEMSALTDSEVEEILVKIKELENIVNSNDRKTKKWENAKEIIKWIADKGVDVGITLLPLLLQIR